MKTMTWDNVSDKEKFGVAVFTFDQKELHRLKLYCGDTVHILKENGGWYFGYCTRNRSVMGIFPKSFVHIKDAVIDKSGPHEVVIVNEPAISHEIAAVLKEWIVIAKQYYVNKNPEFEKIRVMILDLIDQRRHIISGKLPADEFKEVTQKVASLIDIGNWTLHLDLVVRNEQGSILNPDHTSTINLFRKHEEATKRIKTANQGSDQQKLSPKFSHTLYLSMQNIVCKIGDDVQLMMTLYDAKEGRFLSENYVVKWPKEGLTDLDELNNMNAVFTDLGTRDLNRERVFLLCQIIRVGAMEYKDIDRKKPGFTEKKPFEAVRRPFGVAGMDISDILSGKSDYDDDKQHFLPFVQCGDRDFLDTVIKKLTSVKEFSQKERKGQGIWVTLKLLHGDYKQVKVENPHLISITTRIARKMGFPEIILPGDVRNDLYLTLVMGEFSKGTKTSDKNVEVTVKVCNDKGKVIPGVISIGGGLEMMNEYCSVVYYHEDKPKWFETIKVAIPIDDFYNAHLKFIFKHRSSSDAKDKAEKPFAISFVKLLQLDGTTLKNELHELLIYKVDHKKYEEEDIFYLSLPSKKADIQKKSDSDGRQKNNVHAKPTVHGKGLTLSNKDSFQISTLVCSTKLTQNVDLLGLLKWRDNPSNLQKSLTILMNVDGDEVVKFLQDTLDALFNILMENIASTEYDRLVFNALVFILGLIADHKYLHFRPILDAYIENNFSATLADTKLIKVLKSCVEEVNQFQAIDGANGTPEKNKKLVELEPKLRETLNCLEYIFKFIVRSRTLYTQLNEDIDKQPPFELLLKQLLEAINEMMRDNNSLKVKLQATCMKFLPSAIADIMQVFDPKELSKLLVVFLNNVPKGNLVDRKLICIEKIIEGQLFHHADCRAILLPEIINTHLKFHLKEKKELDLCVKCLGDILHTLHSQPVGTTSEDISTILSTIFPTVVQMVIDIDREDQLVGNLVAVFISIIRQMKPWHFKQCIEQFKDDRAALLDFLMQILMVITDLVSKTVFSSDWNEMIMLQNSVLLKTLRQFSHTIRDSFSSPFEKQVWNNFFHAAIRFLTQDVLQLENFSENKRKRIISRYKDMRRETGFEIRAMWYNLGVNKHHFVPSMIGQFLEMTLIPERELRKATIPIFFDMMLTEFYVSKENASGDVSPIPSTPTKLKDSVPGNFSQFEKEIITQLDALISGGRGDGEYKNLFSEILADLCSKHGNMKVIGMQFVTTVEGLLGYLLEYRSVIQDECKENRLACTANLMEFYSTINRQEMYIRYLNKLCDLHVECLNYTEAAFALKLHTHLLDWSDESVPAILKNEKFSSCETHRQLKETLYNKIIEYFDMGKMWEASIEMCKELERQYENEVFDFVKLSGLLNKKATFFDNIMKPHRPEPEYFRVGFFGKGFPNFVQNKVFIFRGKEYEKLDEFSGRLQNVWPKSQIMNKLTSPSQDILNSPQQYLQINRVDPMMEQKGKFVGKVVHHNILKYYKVNDVQKFTYSRPVRKGERDSDNEFSNLWVERTIMTTTNSLPGILKWSQVKSTQMFEISPLENAIETMEATNNKIRNNVVAHHADSNLPVSPLGMLLNGIVDAAVNGGIAKYEQAFFNDAFLEKHNSSTTHQMIAKLKDLIARQIPLLEVGIAIHKVKIPHDLKPFHERLEKCFEQMKIDVEGKYGKRKSELSNRCPVSPRQMSMMMPERPLTAVSLPDINNVGSDLTRPRPSVNLRQSQTASQKLASAGRTQSTFIKQIITPSASKTLRKSRETLNTLRRSSGALIGNEAQTQWYDTKPDASQPVIELKEQLISQRPLRSQRPGSGNFLSSPSATPSPPSTPAGGASTQSLNLSEDDVPPPLPQKHSGMDCGNSASNDAINTSTLPKKKFSQSYYKLLPNFPKEKTPPAVPKRPAKKPLKSVSLNRPDTQDESNC